MSARLPDLPLFAALDGVTVRADAPLGPLTTWKIGGPARWLVEIARADSLVAVIAHLTERQVRWAVLGNGSNVLVSDKGFEGAVLQLVGDLATIALERRSGGAHLVRAGGGASLTRLLRVAKDEALSGLWVLGGVPGTVGGAVKMNAGTRWGEVADTLAEVELARADGLHTVAASALGLAYRHSEIPADSVVARAVFAVGDADEAMRKKLDEVLDYRKGTQPLQLPSCGSVFANPPGDSAGRLIEAVGLKGHKIGGLEISTQHANWIVNRGGGTATDALALMALCQERVAERFAIALRPEVQRFGDFDEEVAP